MKSEVVFLLENAAWPALLVDSAGAISHANAAALALFGSADGSQPRPLSAVWSPDNSGSAEQFLKHWQRSPVPTVWLKFRAKEGPPASCLTCVCSLVQEDQKYFLLQLLTPPGGGPGEPKSSNGETTFAHKQKLDCALQLARSVALDFNNALTSVLGHTSLILSKMEPSHPWRSSLIEVEKSAARAAEIANDLAAFSRQEKEARAQAAGNLNTLLQRSVELFQQNKTDQAVNWTVELERKLFEAKFDEAKMQQAFVKILENAVQAVGPQASITVQTHNHELHDPAQDQNVRLAPGAYVCAEISDNGCGIAPEVLPRIFEPFFTTKRGANHRGLGLAWVYGVVTNHGGGVAVSSSPGAGTSVRVYLPAEKRIIKHSDKFECDLTGTQTVLIVDDEDLLLTMGQTILSSYGYSVRTANSGLKALELLSHNDTPVDLMITDLVMPVMSGRELIERVRQLVPGTRILCTTGYVWPNQQDQAAYLQKPFTSQELLQKVKQMLTGE